MSQKRAISIMVPAGGGDSKGIGIENQNPETYHIPNKMGGCIA
ncbi:hypothetical protein [Labilibaculum euxinus]